MVFRVRRSTAVAVVALAATAVANGDPIALLPGRIALDGPRAAQRVLVETRADDAWSGDLTAKAVFRVTDPRVARVNLDGTIHPLANGSTTLVARVGEDEARAEVVVARFEADEPWSFVNHVEPVLTKAGCNQGSCHGAAAGKNGFRLTLRGYGPEVDYDVLTRQALGRRVNRTRRPRA